MLKPNLHPREAERLKALEALRILDSMPEKEFDDLTMIASQICGTPIALISIVADNRQWFKSKQGLNEAGSARDISFCAHAILQDQVFEVENAASDERFSDNPFVAGPLGLRFYAGAPILDPNTQLPVGTFCVIDTEARKLSHGQLKALEALSTQVSRLLDLRVKASDFVEATKRLTYQKAAFDHMSEGVALQDRTGAIIDFNPAALTILDLSADQLVGKTSLDPSWAAVREDGAQFPGEEHPAMVALRTGKVQSDVIMGIHSGGRKPRWLSVTATPLFLEEAATPSHVVVTFRDITEERNVRLLQIQNAKMRSLGEMSAGLSHEINTPLAVICNSAEQIAKALKAKPVDLQNISERAQKIEATGQRIARIVRGLRTFARDAERDPWIETSVEKLIGDTLELCGERLKHGEVQLQLEMAHDVMVDCAPGQLVQVLLNLLNNSYDSVTESAQEKLLNQTKWIKISVAAEGEVTRIVVADSGQPISKEIQAKMMQPFFTTKEVGKGTGLGLSISKGIIESLYGKFYYNSEAPTASFTIELPVAKSQRKASAA